MKRRVILIVIVVLVLGLIGGGVWIYIRQNTGWRLLTRAGVALNAKGFDRAVELAKRYTAEFPGNWQGYYYQGQAYMGQGKYEEARVPLKRALELRPSGVEIAIALARTHSLPADRVLGQIRRLGRGASYEDIRRLDEAIQDFRDADKVLAAWAESVAQGDKAVLPGDRLDVLEERGMNWVKLGEAEHQKVDLFEKEARIKEAVRDPQEAALKRKEAAAARDEAEKAERQAAQLLKKVVTADATRDRAARAVVQLCIRHNDRETLVQIRQAIGTLDLKDQPPVATMMLAMQELREAVREPFSKDAAEKRNETAGLLDKLIDNLPEDHPDRVSLVLSRAEVALMQKQPEQALRFCELVRKKDPGQARARLCRARARIAQGNLAQAERELSALKTDFPLWEDAQFAYARVATISGKEELGREALRKIVTELNPRHGAALRSLTTYLLAKGFYDQALLDAKAYYDAYPADPQAVGLLVTAAKHTDQPALARSVLEKAGTDHAESPEMLLTVADGWGMLGDREKARAAIRSAANAKPVTITELRAVVLALIRDGRAPEAEKRLYDAKARNPNHPVIHFLLGKLFEATGRRLQAVEEYGRAAALDRSNEGYKVDQARTLFGIGDLTGAEEVLQQVRLPSEGAEKLRRTIRLRKAGVAGDSKLYRTELDPLEAAQSFLNIGQPERCVEICLAELKKNPDEPSPDAHRLLGQAYLVQGKWDECLKEWTEVLKAEPLRLSAYRSIASVRIRTETPEEVEAALKGIPEANGDLVDLTMGWLHDRRRDFETAVAYYGKVADREGATEDLRNRARVSRVQSLANAGKVDQAIAELEKIAGGPAWQRQVLWNKVRLLVAARRLPEAENILTKLCEDALRAQDISLLRDIARLYGSMKQTDKATGVCDEMLKLLPNDARPYLLKAAVLAGAGKLDESVQWYRSAIERQPGNLENYLSLVRIMDLRQDLLQALDLLKQLESRGDTARAAALSERGDLFVRWGLPAQAVGCYEELSRLGYGGTPRIKLALGGAFARLRMKERARQILAGIPKYSRRYVAAWQLLAELADTTEKKLDILDRLNADRPGRSAVLLQKLRILFADGRHGDVVQAYESFASKYGEHGVVPPEASFIALRSYLNEADRKAALELSVRMAERLPRSNWRYVAILLHLPEEPGKAAKMLAPVSETGFLDTLLGLIAAHQAGGDTKPWAERVRAIDRELTERQPSRSIPSSYKILAAVVNGATGQAKAELARFTSASTVGRNVAGELVSFAENSRAASAAEAVKLLQTTVALELRLPTLARSLALDVLTTRPECQWAAALAVGTAPDAATRRKILDMLRPKDCVVAKMILAALAAEEKDFAKTAEIYRSIAEVEKENPEVLRRLASAEGLVGNLEKALTIQRKIWEMSKNKNSVAANNAAYLTAHLWPRDQKKLDEARSLIDGARKAAPNVPAFLDTEGWIAHLRGDDKHALNLLRRAVKGLPESIEVHAHLGVVEAGAGNTELARWHLAAATSSAGRLKAEGQELTTEQLQALKLAEKALSDLGSP